MTMRVQMGRIEIKRVDDWSSGGRRAQQQSVGNGKWAMRSLRISHENVQKYRETGGDRREIRREELTRC